MIFHRSIVFLVFSPFRRSCLAFLSSCGRQDERHSSVCAVTLRLSDCLPVWAVLSGLSGLAVSVPGITTGSLSAVWEPLTADGGSN